LRIRERLGDVRGVALCLSQLGSTALARGDVADAAAHYARSYRLSREIGNPWGMTAALIDLGGTATSMERDAEAGRLYHEALRLALESGTSPQVARIFEACAPLAQRHGQTAGAAELLPLAETAGSATDAGAPEPNLAPATRLLTWTDALAGSITLEEALAA